MKLHKPNQAELFQEIILLASSFFVYLHKFEYEITWPRAYALKDSQIIEGEVSGMVFISKNISNWIFNVSQNALSESSREFNFQLREPNILSWNWRESESGAWSDITMLAYEQAFTLDKQFLV